MGFVYDFPAALSVNPEKRVESRCARFQGWLAADFSRFAELGEEPHSSKPKEAAACKSGQAQGSPDRSAYVGYSLGVHAGSIEMTAGSTDSRVASEHNAA